MKEGGSGCVRSVQGAAAAGGGVVGGGGGLGRGDHEGRRVGGCKVESCPRCWVGGSV